MSFIVGYPPEDIDRIETHIKKLLKHFKPQDFAIVGGLAIRYHLISHGINYPTRPFNDLDMIVENIGRVPVSVMQDFLLFEYHPPKPSGYFIVKLVDEESRTKVDIFPFYPSSPERFVNVPFFGQEINLVGVEDQLVKTLYDALRASPENLVEPKQFSDTKLLASIADLTKASKIWKEKDYPDRPKDFADALKEAERVAAEHPEWLQEKSHIKPFKCSECQPPPGFEITPMEKIFEVLDWK